MHITPELTNAGLEAAVGVTSCYICNGAEKMEFDAIPHSFSSKILK